jgi:hypothetical protein
MANLCWHGFAVSVCRLEPGAHEPAETLVTAAREQAALLVMGGYGHSRLREWLTLSSAEPVGWPRPERERITSEAAIFDVVTNCLTARRQSTQA